MTTWPDLAIVLLTMGALLVLLVAYVLAAQARNAPTRRSPRVDMPGVQGPAGKGGLMASKTERSLGPCARCDEPATVQVTDAPGNVRCDVHADAIGLGPSLKNSHFSLGFDSGRATLVERLTSLEADLQACREAGMVFEEERRRQFKQLLLATEVCEAARDLLTCMGNPSRGQMVYDHDTDEGCMDVLRYALMAVYPTLDPTG